MSTWKGFTEMRIMKGVKEMSAELWEPTRDGKAPRDKGQWEALPPLDMKGKVEGRQGMGCSPMKAGGAQHKNPVHTQVQVEPEGYGWGGRGASNFLGNDPVKVSNPQ